MTEFTPFSVRLGVFGPPMPDFTPFSAWHGVFRTQQPAAAVSVPDVGCLVPKAWHTYRPQRGLQGGLLCQECPKIGEVRTAMCHRSHSRALSCAGLSEGNDPSGLPATSPGQGRSSEGRPFGRLRVTGEGYRCHPCRNSPHFRHGSRFSAIPCRNSPHSRHGPAFFALHLCGRAILSQGM